MAAFIKEEDDLKNLAELSNDPQTYYTFLQEFFLHPKLFEEELSQSDPSLVNQGTVGLKRSDLWLRSKLRYKKIRDV